MVIKNIGLHIFVATLFFLFVGINLNINIYDEGVAVVGAENILNGKLPYVDFWTIYSPTWFYILAFWMSILGKQLILIRLLTFLINVLIVVLFVKISKKILNNTQFVSASTLVLVSLYSLTPFHARNVPLALLVILLSILILLSEIKRKEILVGLLTGFLFTIRHDFALYFFISIFLFFLLNRFFDKTNFDYKSLVCFISSFTLILIIYGVFLWFVGILNGFLQNAFAFPLKEFSKTRSLPFPNPFEYLFDGNLPLQSRFYKSWESVVFYFPWLMVGITIFWLKRIPKQGIKQRGEIILLALVTFFLSFQALVRSDYEHIFPSLMMALLLLGLVVSNIYKTKKFILILMVTIFVLPPTVKKIAQIAILFSPSKTIELASPTGKFIKIPSQEYYYNDLLSYTNRNFKNKSIFSGLTRHDYIYINDVLLYFLTEKQPPTKYYELHPGVATTLEVQKEIASELGEAKVEYIILFANEIFEPQKYEGSKFLDEYIQNNYQMIKTFGKYSVFQRKTNL